MPRLLTITSIAVLAIALVTVFISPYFDFERTHSFEMYMAKRAQLVAGSEQRVREVESLRLAGDAALKANRYSEAESTYLTALRQAEKLGSDNMLMAFCYHDLASMYATQERLADAEPLFRKAARIWELTRGPNDPYVATALDNLAGLLRETGRAAEAVPLEARVLEIRSKSGGAKTH